jgi:hypothetical protein
MKAQFVNENIAFKRGRDSKDSLNVGEASIRRNWLEEFKNDDNPLKLFEIIMLGYIKDYTDFTKSWAQLTTGEFPGRVTFVLERSHPAKKQMIYLSIDEDGEISRSNGVRKMGNITDLLFDEGREQFIEEIKWIDNYHEG